jgi:hypothetical protein
LLPDAKFMIANNNEENQEVDENPHLLNIQKLYFKIEGE